MRTLLIAAAFVLAIAGSLTPALAMGIDAATQTVLSHYKLTEKDMNAFGAVISEAQNKAVPDLGSAEFMGETTSIDSLAQKLDAAPGMSAILSEHGLTAEKFATISLALSQGVMALTAPAGSPVTAILGKPNPENVPFYKAHRSEILKLMDAQG